MFGNVDKRFRQIDYEPMDETELMEFARMARDRSLEYKLTRHSCKRAYVMPCNGFVIIINHHNDVTAYDPVGSPTGLEMNEIEAIHYFYKEMGLLKEESNGN